MEANKTRIKEKSVEGISKDQKEVEVDHWVSEFGISKEQIKVAEKSGKTPAETVEEFVKHQS
jgi:hypothetical protein